MITTNLRLLSVDWTGLGWSYTTAVRVPDLYRACDQVCMFHDYTVNQATSPSFHTPFVMKGALRDNHFA